MATILELANHAGLSTETVLRVVLREPTNEDARRRVLAAIETLGPPDYPRPDRSIEVLPPGQDDPLETPAAEAPPSALPATIHDALPDAIRAQLAQIGEFREACDSLVSRLRNERRERIEDLELVTDLLITSWRGVDRRLGRLEKVIGRIDDAQRESREVGRATPNVIRFEPRQSPEAAAEEMPAQADSLDSPGANPGA